LIVVKSVDPNRENFMKFFSFFNRRSEKEQAFLRSSDGLLRSFEALLTRSHDKHLILNHSIARLTSDAPKKFPSIAVATCLPPAATGIATASIITFREAPIGVDAFTCYDTAADYFSGISDLRIRGSNLRIFDLACMPLAVGEMPYGAQIFVVGNSDHNLPIVAALKRARMFPPQAPIWVYIHDPGLLNIFQRWCESVDRDFQAAVFACYGKPVGELYHTGAFGMRALLHDVPTAGIIVNSQAAREIVLREMPDVNVQVLFHPVVDVGRSVRFGADAGPLRIGTFGVPNAAKRTEVVIEAFELLKQQYDPAARLVIAGFDAADYAQRQGLRPADGYEIYDAPGDDVLHDLMAGVDVAVQLRDRNFGESSGVIARLLTIGTPTVASGIGAFGEYGDAVALLEPEAGARKLAELIRTERLAAPSRASTMAAYSQDHSPAKFCARLMNLLGVHSVEALRAMR
jgi:glycosyltransferase involved in cell wall biosynthesis